MAEAGARASVILGKMKDVGVTHIVGLPDNSSAALFAIADADPAIQLITVTREGEAFAIASGLWIGGKLPVVVIQNTGLLESGDSLRGTASRIGVPLLILVTCRGWSRLHAVETDAAREPDSRDMLVNADFDSVAFLTEPTFEAWRIPHARYGSADDSRNFDAMWQLAAGQQRPTALLITHALV